VSAPVRAQPATAPVVSPITGEEIGRVPDRTAADVAAAFARARAAFRTWRRVAPSERGRLLAEVGRRMRARREEIAQLETLNTGKLLRDVRREVERAAACFEYFGGWADKAYGETIPVGDEYHTYTLREPHGVAVGIIPWNVPYVFAAKKLAPALAFGNAAILKPALETPLSALALEEVLAEVGLPDGVAQVLTGGGEVGRALVESPEADAIAFTGSDATGRAIATAAGARLTPVVLELGGKSPQIVFDDADLDSALRGVLLGVFAQCGQMCIAGSRLFVQDGVREAFTERLAAAVRELRVGDPRREGTQVGPQTTAAQRDKTLRMVEAAIEDGARVVARARTPEEPGLRGGFWASPTVLADVDPASPVARDEVFGPVLSVTGFADEEEALRVAHETEFGLAAGVWTRDVARAHRMARELEAGHVWLNTYRIISDLVPFGGIGRSGYGREGGPEAARFYTRVKSVWTALQPGSPAGFEL
jgi:aldehyde dehydrogenase (NAD+)